jgi:hypothetical protein
MVVVPLVANRPFGSVAAENVIDEVGLDIADILSECAELSPDEISSHTVLRATDNVWDRARSFVDAHW